MKDLASISGKPVQTFARHVSGGETPQVRMVEITEDEAGQRIDNFLLRECKGVPKSHLYRVLRSGEVRVNRGRVDQTYRLACGDVVRIPPVRVAEKSSAAVPPAEFPILFEDAHLLALNKPAGVAVHGGSGVSFGVIEQLRAARPDAKFLELVHRLDRDTSGILLLAKKRSALTSLHEAIRDGRLDKRYLALVHGDWPDQRRHVRLPLLKYNLPDGERRVRVQADGMPSHTIFNLRKRYGNFTLLEAELKTGRTHQIRVHLASSGYPIVGDDKYGEHAANRLLQRTDAPGGGFRRMFLHAYQLRFAHPATGEMVALNAALPPECERFLGALDDRIPA